MKVIIEFDTEIENDFNLHKTYIKAEDMALALYDIKQSLRSIVKYEELPEVVLEKVESIQEKFFEIINDYDLAHIID